MTKEQNYKKVMVLANAIVSTLNQPDSVKLKYDETIPDLLDCIMGGIEIPMDLKKAFLLQTVNKYK